MRNWNWLCWRLLCKKIFCSCFHSFFAPVNLCTAVCWFKSSRWHGILKAKQIFYFPQPEFKKDTEFSISLGCGLNKKQSTWGPWYPVSQMLTSLPLWDYISSGSRFKLLKLWNIWNSVCLEIWETFLHLKTNLPVVSFMQVKPCFFIPFNWSLSHLLQGMHLSFLTSAFIVLSAISSEKVPPCNVLTFKAF